MTRPAIDRLRALLERSKVFLNEQTEIIFRSCTDGSGNFPDSDDMDHYDAMMLLISDIDEFTPALPALLAAAEDAERYRWLRDRSILRSDLPSVYVVWNQYKKGKFIGSDNPSHAELDSAIDAALVRKEG